MKVRHLCVNISAVLTLLCVLAGITSAQDKPSLKVRPQGEKYLYSLGDTVEFIVSARGNGLARGRKQLRYRISRDGGEVLDEGSLELKDGSATVRGALTVPGFLRVDLTLPAGEDTLAAACGCGVDVGGILPSGRLPEDFGNFWRLTRAELIRHPLEPSVQEVEAVDPGDARRFKISLRHPDGGRVHGWLHLPQGGEGPFPTVLSIPGSGIGRTGRYAGFTSAGYAVFAIEIHGLEPSRENIGAVDWVEPDSTILFFREVQSGVLNNYHELGKEDPYHYIHRRSLLAAMRAMDYLHARKDIDNDHIAVFGGSQGGGLSLLMAAIDKRARAVIATVPGSCDQTARLYGRCGGPDRLAGGDRDRVIRALSYYDAALAAGLIEVPVYIGVGFIDATCRPTRVYAAFNNLKGPRAIENFYNMGHGSAPDWREKSIAWLDKQFGR
jgi:cephalosporin-C deacetylase